MVQENVNSPPDVQDFFAENLKFLRNQKGLSQKEFAEIFKLTSNATITFWEKKDGSRPSFSVFLKICAFFGKTPNEMLLENLSQQGGSRASPSNGDPPPGAEKLQDELNEIKERLAKLEAR